MRKKNEITNNIDWLTLFIYFVLALLGWINIYAAVYDESLNQSIFNLSTNSGRQFVFIIISCLVIIAILVIDYKFYELFGYFVYGGVMLLLLFVLLFGKEIAGSKSWFVIGPIHFQPSEFAKFATSLAIAKYIGSVNFRMNWLIKQFMLFVFISIPIFLIILQGDIGTALVFSIFLFVFFREGMSPYLLIFGLISAIIFILTLLIENHIILYLSVGIICGILFLTTKKLTLRKSVTILIGGLVIAGIIRSVDYIISDILKPHHQNRIKSLINPEADPLGYGWNVTQSKIAIGSGGFAGKGFLNGTQTKFDFVPEQSTDFIFCTIGEEHGWVGSLFCIALFLFFFLRIIYIAERQKWRFARVYGYCTVCIMFFHFSVNIAMTIGLFPVIGIPLPLFSYGGSSLIGFTILLAILLKLDAHRDQFLEH